MPAKLVGAAHAWGEPVDLEAADLTLELDQGLGVGRRLRYHLGAPGASLLADVVADDAGELQVGA